MWSLGSINASLVMLGVTTIVALMLGNDLRMSYVMNSISNNRFKPNSNKHERHL